MSWTSAPISFSYQIYIHSALIILFFCGLVPCCMKVEIEGLDELEDALNDMLGDALELDETNEIPFIELFPPDFMRLYTDFDNIEEFFEASPWSVESQEDFRDIPQEDFDEYIDTHTDFPDWEVMQQTAGKQYIEKQFQ